MDEAGKSEAYGGKGRWRGLSEAHTDHGLASSGGMRGMLIRASDWLHRDRFVPDEASSRDRQGMVPPRSTGQSEAGIHQMGRGGAPRCERHGIAHTGKLARSIIIDLAVHDACVAGADDRSGEHAWNRALARADWVIGRLAPDPHHGGLVFWPGRLDARNNSTSLIDAGECVDALAELIRHPRFEAVPEVLRTRVIDAVTGCASTYLSTSVATRGIVNQMLWGAMGLAHACAAVPGEAAWRDGVRGAVDRALGAQHPDGSWGYETGAGHASHPGTADLTVYYHGRCLAFLHHIRDVLPEFDDDGRVLDALRRGTDFLSGVVAGDGRKPLAIEGKRWFWSGQDEVGSHAFDIHALVRGARLTGDDGLLTVAWRSWRSLVARIDVNGAVRAGGVTDPLDIVCPDFHTADLAWVARVWRSLEGDADHPQTREVTSTARHWADAGVARVAHGPVSALVRTRKSPANTQWGGAVGGATVVATATGPVPWVDGPFTPGSLTVRRTGRSLRERVGEIVAGTRRFLVANRPGREGRQWAFVWRMQARSALAHLLAGQSRGAWQIGWGMVRGAVARTWRLFISELHDHASLHAACTIEKIDLGVTDDGAWLRSAVRPARRDGSTPGWADGMVATREVCAMATGIVISDRIDGDVPVSCAIALDYVLPLGATDVRLRGTGDIAFLIDGEDLTGGRGDSGVSQEWAGRDARGPAGTREPDPGWCVWQGSAHVRAMVRAERSRPPVPGTAGWSLEVTYGRPN